MALFGQIGTQLPPGVAECEKLIEDVNGEITEEQFNNLKGYYDEYWLSTDYNQMLDSL